MKHQQSRPLCANTDELDPLFIIIVIPTETVCINSSSERTCDFYTMLSKPVKQKSALYNLGQQSLMRHWSLERIGFLAWNTFRSSAISAHLSVCFFFIATSVFCCFRIDLTTQEGPSVRTSNCFFSSLRHLFVSLKMERSQTPTKTRHLWQMTVCPDGCFLFFGLTKVLDLLKIAFKMALF